MNCADAVLRMLLSRRHRDAVSGDLLETYREEVLPSRGPLRARVWYWRQVFSFISPAMFGLAMGAVLGGLNLIETVRHPLADDDGGVMLTYVALVWLVWSAVGFAAARRTRRLADGVKAGLLVGVAMMVVFDLAAILRVNLFLDLIRYREDWQNLVGRFGRSDFDSLRLYANYEYLRNTPIVVAIGAAAGTLAGLLGGTTAVIGQRRRPSVSTETRR